jgi:hypothetical protein
LIFSLFKNRERWQEQMDPSRGEVLAHWYPNQQSFLVRMQQQAARRKREAAASE